MLNRVSIIVSILAIVALAACAGTNKPEVVYNYYPVKKASEVEEKVRQANSLSEEGEYKAASKIYSGLLEEYSSTDGSFQTALITNLCLGYLEQGERRKFKGCAEKLKDVSKDLPYLSRETQMILQLNDSLGGSVKTGDDLRIESRITDGLTEIFKEGR